MNFARAKVVLLFVLVSVAFISQGATIQFGTSSETAAASAGTFKVPVTLNGSRSLTTTTFASGFFGPFGVTFDIAGNLYVADYNGNAVSKVTPSGITSTFATVFNAPSSLAVDASGNLYVADVGDGTVSKVTPAGVVSTFASSGSLRCWETASNSRAG